MKKDMTLKDIWLRFRQVKPWIAVATALALALALYYGFQGYRYWEAREATAALRTETATLRQALASGIPSYAAEEAKLAALESAAGAPGQAFQPLTANDLMVQVSAIGQDNRLFVSGVTAGDPKTRQRGDTQFVMQPLTMNLSGQPDNFFAFLTQLQAQIPAIEVVSFRVLSLDSAPLAQLQLAFYHTPNPAPEKKGSK